MNRIWSGVKKGGQPLVVALVVALVAGTTGAVAGSLITGKDIQNGSVKAKDLSKKVRSKLNQAGSDGTAGAPGAQGPQGEAGQTGPAGTAGPAGADGDDGADGADGADGDDGDDGDDGADGADGLDSGTPRVVTASNLQGWQLLPRGTNPDPSDNGVIEFADAPATEPLGTSALRMNTVNGKNVSAVIPLPTANAGDFPRLEELSTATFSSYVDVQPQAGLDVAMKFAILGSNACGTGGSGCPGNNANGFTTLTFEPSNNRDQNPDVVDTWQRWDVADGKFWSSRALADNDCQNSADATNGWCTIDDFLSDPTNRDAIVTQVRLEIGQNSGAAFPTFDAYVDDARLGFDGGFLRYDLGG